MQETHGQQQTRRALEQLTKKLKTLGRGSIGRVEQGLNKGSNWLRDRRRCGKIDLGLLLDTFNIAQLNPVRFFHELFEYQGEHLIEPRGTQPPLVTKALERLTTKTTTRQHIDETYLHNLDMLRYDQPEQVLTVGEEVIDHIDHQLIPNFLGVMGSAWRILYHTTSAEHAIVAGMKCAQQLENERVFARLLRRLVYIEVDKLNHHEALRLSKEATLIFARNTDLPGMGQALVDQGMCYYYLKQTHQAIASQQAALQYLAEDDSRHRFAANQGLGLYYLELNDPDTASRHAERARQWSTGIESLNLGRLYWLQAGIELQRERYDEAEQFLEDTIGLFKTIHPADTALAVTDLIHVQLLGDNRTLAYQNAAAMVELLKPLNRNSHITAAMMELIRCGLEGQGLTIALVARIRGRIEQERERQMQRSRRQHQGIDPALSAISLM